MDKELSLLSAFIAYFLKMFMIKEKDIEKAGIQKVASSKVTRIQRCIMKTDLKFSVLEAHKANGSLYSILSVFIQGEKLLPVLNYNRLKIVPPSDVAKEITADFIRWSLPLH